MSNIDSLTTAIANLTEADRKTLFAQVSAAASAGSAEDARLSRLAKLNAAKADPAHRSNIAMLEGLLRRGGVTLDDVAGADIVEVDKIFAGSRLSSLEKMQAKSLLHRFGGLA